MPSCAPFLGQHEWCRALREFLSHASWRRFVTLAIAPMMGVRTPRMPAAPRVGRSGSGLQFGLRRLLRRVERARPTLSSRGSASRSWQPARLSGLRLHQLAPMAYRAQHQGLVLSRTGSPAIDVPLGVGEIGRQLSERSCATASAVAGSLSEDRSAPAKRHSGRRNTPIGGGTRLPPITAGPANRRFERPPSPTM